MEIWMLYVGVCWAMVLKEGYGLEKRINVYYVCSYGLERSKLLDNSLLQTDMVLKGVKSSVYTYRPIETGLASNGLERSDICSNLHGDLNVCLNGLERSQFDCKCCYNCILISQWSWKELICTVHIMVLKEVNLRGDLTIWPNGLERSIYHTDNGLESSHLHWNTLLKQKHTAFQEYVSLGGCGGPERTEFCCAECSWQLNRRIRTGYVPDAWGRRRRPWPSLFSSWRVRCRSRHPG